MSRATNLRVFILTHPKAHASSANGFFASSGMTPEIGEVEEAGSFFDWKTPPLSQISTANNQGPRPFAPDGV